MFTKFVFYQSTAISLKRLLLWQQTKIQTCFEETVLYAIAWQIIADPGAKRKELLHDPEFSLCFVTTQREQQRWMGEGSSCVRSA